MLNRIKKLESKNKPIESVLIYFEEDDGSITNWEGIPLTSEEIEELENSKDTIVVDWVDPYD